MRTSKEYKAVRNCILNELHLTKEDIIKNIESLLEKLVKQCMNNTYGNNNQIEKLELEDKNDPDVHKVYEAGMHYIYSN